MASAVYLEAFLDSQYMHIYVNIYEFMYDQICNECVDFYVMFSPESS